MQYFASLSTRDRQFRALAGVGTVAALLLTIRAGWGPVQIGGVQMGSPLGVESVFAGIFLILVLLKSGGAAVRTAADQLRVSHVLAVLAIVASLFVWNLRDPFLSDDYILLSREPRDLARWLSRFAVNTSGDGSFRPVGDLYFALMQNWAQADPLRWHVSSLVLHLANCALLYVVVFALWENEFLAFAASLLFGIHGTRPEVVAWTAGSFDLLACGFTLAAALCVLQKRLRLPRIITAVSLVLLTLAVWSKESAYAAPVVIFLFAVAANRAREPGIRRFLICAAVLCVALFVHRWWLMNGPGGYIDPATGRLQILSLDPVSTAKALVARLWAILLFPANWESRSNALVLGGALLVGCLSSLALLSPRRPVPLRVSASLLGMSLVSLLPAIHLSLIGQSALGSRVLYLPSIGFCVLFAHLIMTCTSRLQRFAALTAVAVCCAVVLIHNLGAWHRTALLADAVCTDAAVGRAAEGVVFPPGRMNGVYFFANGFPECVAMKSKD